MSEFYMNELMPLITEVIDSGGAFKLYPKGKSMLPTIREGKDSVLLSKPDKIKLYDIVLYKRENGQYVLHRAVKIHADRYDMCGDNQLWIEKGIKKDDILAKVTALFIENERIDADSEKFIKNAKRLYAKKPFKRVIAKTKMLLYPAYRRIFKK